MFVNAQFANGLDSTAEKCSFFAHVPAYTNHVEVRGKK